MAEIQERRVAQLRARHWALEIWSERKHKYVVSYYFTPPNSDHTDNLVYLSIPKRTPWRVTDCHNNVRGDGCGRDNIPTRFYNHTGFGGVRSV